MSRTDIENPRPRTATVLLLLVTAAMTISYLIAYAVTNALVASNMMPAWSPGDDPRPEWMIKGFLFLCGGFALAAGAARFLSYRQLKHIDAMNDEDGAG